MYPFRSIRRVAIGAALAGAAFAAVPALAGAESTCTYDAATMPKAGAPRVAR